MDTVKATGAACQKTYSTESQNIFSSNHEHRLYLWAVCLTFRQAIPLPPKLSLTLPLPPGAHPNIHGGHLLLKQSSVIYTIKPLHRITKAALCDETTKTRLDRVEELISGKVRVKSVLDGSPHAEYSSKKLLPKSLNLLDYRVEKLAIAYGLKYVHRLLLLVLFLLKKLFFLLLLLLLLSMKLMMGLSLWLSKRAIANCWFGEKKMVGDTFNLKIRALQILPIIMKDSMP